MRTGGGSFDAGVVAARRGGPSAEEIRMAMAWRARNGGGWLAAARVIGCSEHALRLACDPTYQPVHDVARPVVAAPGAAMRAKGGRGAVGGTRVMKARRAATGPRPGTLIAGVMMALVDGSLGSVALGIRLGRDKNAVNGALKGLKAAGLASDAWMGGGRALRWSLTRAGMTDTERLKDLIEREGDET